ncbi:MAG: hypothetical protein NT136_02850 [Candidatus Moranbacteria bacterium]|nr:hypothetical protein [Candidatus Moranbacteria bacterium]
MSIEKSKIKSFWNQYETKIILISGFILVASISFEAGVLKGQKWQQKPLIIEKLAGSQDIPEMASPVPPDTQNLPPEGTQSASPANIPLKDCAFVGSKNSTKYHRPTCQWAKRIKPENTICFKSGEEAKSKGYTPCGTCIK